MDAQVQKQSTKSKRPRENFLWPVDTHQYHSPHSLTVLIHAYSLTAIFGCFLLYWVYISGYLFIKQYHLICVVQKLNLQWCFKVTEEYCKQRSCSFSQPLQAQSVASGNPEIHRACLPKAADCRTFRAKTPSTVFCSCNPSISWKCPGSCTQQQWSCYQSQLPQLWLSNIHTAFHMVSFSQPFLAAQEIEEEQRRMKYEIHP